MVVHRGNSSAQRVALSAVPPLAKGVALQLLIKLAGGATLTAPKKEP
jgi:hypothetical protein